MYVMVPRVSNAHSAHPFDKMGAEIEAAPAGAESPNRGLTEPLGGSAMGNRSNRADERRLIALGYLTRVADDLDQAALTRIRYMHNARRYGATWTDIGTALRMSEAGARMLYARNRDLVGGDA